MTKLIIDGREIDVPPEFTLLQACEAAGAEIPPDESELHVPRARFHALLARDFGPPDLVEPIYLRVPDAEKAR